MGNIGTGLSGFIGSQLLTQWDISPIPHEKIAKEKLPDFDRFFFISSYGNIVTQTDHEKILQANVLDLIHIINEAIDHPFKSFVFISTSSVKLRTQTMYSRSKRAAEEVLLSYMERFNKPICIVRPFSVTGVGEQKEHLIPTLIRSCMTGELVNFVPNPVHDFIDVQDVVSGITNLTDHFARGIFELGTGRAYSNQQVLEIVESITKKKANINIISSARPYDTDQWV